MKYWEVIADKLSAAGWSWGYRVLSQRMHREVAVLLLRFRLLFHPKPTKITCLLRKTLSYNDLLKLILDKFSRTP